MTIPDLRAVFIAIYTEFKNQEIPVTTEFRTELENDEDIISQITMLKHEGVPDDIIAKFIVSLFTSSSNFQDFKKNFKDALQKLSSLLTTNKKFDHESFKGIVIQEFINLVCAGLDYNTVAAIIAETVRASPDFQTFKGTLFQITAIAQTLNKQVMQKLSGDPLSKETLQLLQKKMGRSIVNRLKNKKTSANKEDFRKALEEAITSELKKIIPETKFNINLIDEVLQSIDKLAASKHIAPQIHPTEIAELPTIKAQTSHHQSRETQPASTPNINKPTQSNHAVKTQTVVEKPSFAAKVSNNSASEQPHNNNKMHELKAPIKASSPHVEGATYSGHKSLSSIEKEISAINIGDHEVEISKESLTPSEQGKAMENAATLGEKVKELTSDHTIEKTPETVLHPPSTPDTKGPEHGQGQKR